MSDALKRTPLYDAHIAAGARLVDFGGWEMPLHYGSQIEEHHAVRRSAGVFDVSHMRSVDIEGEQTREFLRWLLANDVNKLTQPGRALYSCMLNPQGGVIDDLIVYYLSQSQWRLVVNAACAQTDLEWILSMAKEGDYAVSVTPRQDLAMLALQGPQALTALEQVRPEWARAISGSKPFGAAVLDQTVVARTGYTGEDGVEIMLLPDQAVSLWHELLDSGVKPCGLGARDTLRLEAGMSLYGQDMNDMTLPAQAGLSWTVSLKDPDRVFIGREALEQSSNNEQLVGLMLQEKGVMRSHMAVQTFFGPGEITSGTMSPTIGLSIAMARLPAQVSVGDSVTVIMRGKSVPAKVCKLPFVRHGQVVEHAV